MKTNPEQAEIVRRRLLYVITIRQMADWIWNGRKGPAPTPSDRDLRPYGSLIKAK